MCSRRLLDAVMDRIDATPMKQFLKTTIVGGIVFLVPVGILLRSSEPRFEFRRQGHTAGLQQPPP
jgi:hypothetical protein